MKYINIVREAAELDAKHGYFLTRGYGPEQQALVQMIGTLIESTPGELLTGEGNPGLAVSGGSGHA
jgi:hypothetical protein